MAGAQDSRSTRTRFGVTGLFGAVTLKSSALLLTYAYWR